MNLIEMAPGLYPGVPHDVYHQRVSGIVSKTALDLVNRSPAHLKAWLDGAADAGDGSDALRFGNLFHCGALEPARFASSYVVTPDFGDCRKKDNKAARDAWRAEVGWDEDPAKSKVVELSVGDDKAIRGMVASMRAHPLVSRMLKDGEPELTVRWNDEETGIPCKTRLDYFVRPREMIVDLKSADDASPEAFRRSIAKYRYHVQDALYRAGCAGAGVPAKHFVFVVVEKRPPFAIGVYTLDHEGVAAGHTAARRNVAQYAYCVRNNDFPGYSQSIETLILPPWAA